MKPQRLSSSSSLSLLSNTDGAVVDGVGAGSADVNGSDVDGGDAVDMDGVDAGVVDAADADLDNVDADCDVVEFRNPLSSEIGDKTDCVSVLSVLLIWTCADAARICDDRLIPVRKSKFNVDADADADADTDTDADADDDDDDDASLVFDRLISLLLQRPNR